jgi:hypothetical protein
VIGQLAENYPDSGWAKIATGSFAFGSGGIGGTGAQCGNYIGAGAVLNQMGLGGATAHFLRWFENTAIPTNAAFIDYRSGDWTPTATNPAKTATWGGGTGMPIPLNNAPKVKPQTTTCHGAHTKWKVVASSWLKAKGAGANQDRCGKTTYDSVYKLCTMINEMKAAGTTTLAAPPDAVVNGCRTAGCHAIVPGDPVSGYPATGVSGVITCQPCHSTVAGITPGHGL